MPKFTMRPGGEGPPRELLPDGEVYAAEVEGAELRPLPWDDEKKEVNFRFKIIEPGKFQGRIVFGSTPPWFNRSEKCTLRLWSEAILGLDKLPDSMLDGEEEFDTDDLIGMHCRVAMAVREKKNPNPDGTPAFSNFVRDVLPAKAVQSAEEIFGAP